MRVRDLRDKLDGVPDDAVVVLFVEHLPEEYVVASDASTARWVENDGVAFDPETEKHLDEDERYAEDAGVLAFVVTGP